MSTSDDTATDETTIVRLRAQLAAAEARYATLASAIPNSWIIVFDHDLRAVAADGAGLDQYVTPASIRSGVALAALLPDDSAAALMPHCRHALDGTDSALSLLIQGRPHDVQVLPMRDATGQSSGGMLIVYDVSAQHETTQRLKLFERLADLAPDGISVIDHKGIRRYVNPAFTAMLGVEEATNTSITESIVPADQERLSALFNAIWQKGQARDELTYRRPDGTTFPAAIAGFLITDTQGKATGSAAIIRDLTEQHATAAALRASAEQLRLMITNLPIIVYTLDHNGIFTYSNGKGLADLGLQPGQVVGRSFFDLYSEFPELLQIIQRGLNGESLFYTTPAQDNELMFDMWYEPIRDEAGSVTELLGIAINITDRMQAEKQRRQLQEQVIAAQQAALRELSTPLLPISDKVLVLPIIGAVDTRRASQLMEALLQGIAERGATTAILDITGVQVVDTQVANALVQTAQAAQLLGTRVVLTGIRPEVAQTLISLGVELRGIITHATLQSGIAFALR